MVRKSWLKSLMGRVSKSASSAPQKRWTFRLRPVELLEDRLAPASVSLVAGNLQLNYAAASEAVTIANDGANVTVSGAATGTFPAATVTQFTATDPSSAAGQSLTLAAGVTLN